MAREKKTTSSLWARLAVNYYRDPAIIEVGPVAELAYVRLIALARENIMNHEDGQVSEVLARRELMEVFDLYDITRAQDAPDLFQILDDAALITRDNGIVNVVKYADWQTTQTELATYTRRKS